LDAGVVAPAVVLVDRLDAKGALAGLEVEALGPHAVVERGEVQKILIAGLHDGDRRAHAGDAFVVEVAGAEGVAAEDVAVAQVREEAAAAERDEAARDVADDGGDGLD